MSSLQSGNRAEALPGLPARDTRPRHVAGQVLAAEVRVTR